MRLQGSMVAIATPMKDGKADLRALRALAEWQVAEGTDGIVPCGIAGHGVTSLAELGAQSSMEVVDNALRDEFERCFARTRSAREPIGSVQAPVSGHADR